MTERIKRKHCVDCAGCFTQPMADHYVEYRCRYYAPKIDPVTGHKTYPTCRVARNECNGFWWKPRKRNWFERLFGLNKHLKEAYEN